MSRLQLGSQDLQSGESTIPMMIRFPFFVSVQCLLAVAPSTLLFRTATADEPTVPVVEASVDILSDAEWRRLDDSSERALAWLADQQQADGSFPTQKSGQPGVTSLVVLAFLSRNHLPGEGPYGPTLTRAVDFILTQQKPNGLISAVGPAGEIVPEQIDFREGWPAPYNHAISSLTLSEVFAMTRDRRPDRVRRTIEVALKLSLKLQKRPTSRQIDVGGWRYLQRNSDMDSDVSITSWYLMSLRSAKNAGFDVAQQPIDDALNYIERMFDPQHGTFINGQRSVKYRSQGMAGAGILALAHGGRHHSDAAKLSGDWLLERPMTRFLHEPYPKDSYYYSVFYCCQGMYQLGGNHWAVFFPPTIRTLVSNQQPDGSWVAPRNELETVYGSTYATAMAVLAISAPNQILPVFQR